MIKDIYKLMLKYGFRPQHRLDQNFIIDQNIVFKVIETIFPKENETVLEIGPGLGFLTKELLDKFKKVIVIEKDPVMVEILKKEINSEKLEIINQDFLDVDLSKIEFDKIVGFIPYSISLKIIEKIIGSKPACLVVQKEFAEKLTAFEGFSKYVSITVLCQTYADVKLIKNIKKASFFPKPKVDSSIISIIPNNKKIDIKYNHFIKNIFRYPNKDVLKALKHSSQDNKEIVNISKLNLIEQKITVKKIKQLSVSELEKVYNVISF